MQFVKKMHEDRIGRWLDECKFVRNKHTQKQENIFTDLGHATTNRMLFMNMHVYGERGRETDI